MEKAFEAAVFEIEMVLARKRPLTEYTKLAAHTVYNFGRIRATEVAELALRIHMEERGMKEVTA